MLLLRRFCPTLACTTPNARERVAYEKTITWYDKTKDKSDNDVLFFHLPFHSPNPPLSNIQSLLQDIIATPSDAKKLTNLTNYSGHKIPISKLIVAYSRPPNLGDLLSCCKVKSKTQGHHPEIEHDNALHFRER